MRLKGHGLTKRFALGASVAMMAITVVLACGTSLATAGNFCKGNFALSVPATLGRAAEVPLPTEVPLSTAECLKEFELRCYVPAQLAKAYNLAGLQGAGINGSGETIAIVIPFGSPTIHNDLHQFDQTFGVNNSFGVPVDPAIAKDPQLTIIQPAGPVPPFSTTAFNGGMLAAASETTLDVEWAHVMAPGANILLVETPTYFTGGVGGFPEIVTAENYVINHHLAGVISQSFGETEENFPGTQIPSYLRSAFQNAQQHNVTVLAASGNHGSTEEELNGEDLYPMPVTYWPASDPLVTGVGGTQLTLDESGNRLSPDVVWNDTPLELPYASGGGLSAIFKRPDFQNTLQSVVGNQRGVPDISMSAACNGFVWTYSTYEGPSYHFDCGTSEATQEFGGIVAMADQVAGQPLGDINKALYSIPYGGGLVDVTSGNNDIGPFTNSNGVTYHVPGFNAGPGYDLASGLGTVDPARFVPALANAAGTSHANATCRGAVSFASIGGNLDVPKGAACTLTDSVVRGNVSVEGTFTGNGVSIGGNLQAHGGGKAHGGGTVSLNRDSAGEPSIVGGDVQIYHTAGGANIICGSRINGNLQVQNNTSPSLIGTTGACTVGNTIVGSLQVHNNAAEVTVSANTANRNIQVNNNTIGGGTLTSNTAGGKCELKNDRPPITGTANKAGTGKTNTCNRSA
ncbi:MAG: hypothetical protein ACLQMH_06165 [Solirubrobacteraceae bacterium]